LRVLFSSVVAVALQLSVICNPEQAGRVPAKAASEKGNKLKTKNKHAVILLKTIEVLIPHLMKEERK
jgi:hypothetical protein